MDEIDFSLLNEKAKKELIEFYHFLIIKYGNNENIKSIYEFSCKLKNFPME